MGQSPPGTSYNRNGHGAPLINGPTEFTARYPVPKQWTTAPVRFCEAGDVLICVRGSSTGRTNIADTAYCIGRGVAAVRASRGNDQTFVQYALAAVVADLLKLQTGSTFPSIDSRVIRGGAVLIPDPREQRRIGIALLEADYAIAVLERMIAKKQAIKQGVMQRLLTGKTRLPGFTKPWREDTLGSVGACYRGVGYDPDADLSPGDRPWTVRLLRSNNVQAGVLDLHDLQFVHERRVSPRQILIQGDIVICMANGSRPLVGKAAYFNVPDRPIRYAVGAFMGAFRTDNKIADPRFIAELLGANSFRNWLDVILSGSSINNLRPSEVENFSTALPDRVEQQAIADVLEDATTEIARLKRRLAKACAIKTGMMQVLLTGRTRLPVEEYAA